MFFKKLEIQGFKSFANKTTIEFTPGATIIVGPNGCGKSNVLDSIRWVLGEQRARALRGQRMGDIIFNGSASVKAMNFARVSMLMNNENRVLDLDATEVQIGRQLLRSGDSEYQINRMHCKMKTIQDLLMDTGAGVNAYSVLEQGRVDQIVTAKPIERRLLFEEAAGISRYRQRKTETLRKLERTETDLERLADIIREVKGQSISLKRQANRALRFKALDAELTQLEMALIALLYGKEKVRRDEVKAKLDEASKALEVLNTQLETLEADLEKERQDRDTLEQQVQALQRQLTMEREAISQSERAVALYDERRGSYDRQSRQLGDETEGARRHVSRLEAQVEEMKGRSQELATEVESLLKDRDEKMEKQQSIRRDQEKGRAELRDRQKELDRLREHWRRRENEARLAASKCETIQTQIGKAHEQLTRHSERRAQLGERLEEKNAQIAGLEKAIAQQRKALEEEVRVKAQGEEELGQKLAELESVIQLLSESSSRLEALRELEERFEGYGSGVREVMQAGEAGALLGIRGVLPHLIRSQAEFETALEIALGSSIEDIVTDTAEQAARAIAFLRKNELGRARFLPLDAIHPVPVDERFRQIIRRAGVIGFAADLVECQDWLRPVAQAILGGTVLVEDLDVALGLGREGVWTRYVTLHGEVVSSKGAIAGGDLLPSTLLGREREIHELKERVDVLRQREKHLREGVFSHRELLRVGTETLNSLREDVHKHDVELARARNEREQVTQALGDIAKRLEEQSATIREMMGDLEKTQSQIGAIEKEAGEAEQKVRQAEGDIETRQGSVEAMDKALAAASEALNQTSMALTSARERFTALKDRMASLEGEKRRVARSIEQKTTQIETLKEQIATADRERTEIGGKLEAMQGRKAQTETQLQEVTQERQKHLNALDGLRQTIQNLSRDRNQCQNRVHDADLKHQQSELKLDQLNEQAREKFRKTTEEVVEEVQALRERYAERLRAEAEAPAEAEADGPSPPLAQDAPPADSPEAGATPPPAEGGDEDGDATAVEEEPLYDLPTDAAELKARIAPLREQIARLGPINTVAIEEYDQLRERYAFLQTQERDMAEARESLIKTIKTIDKTSREMFREAFDKINANFQDVFRRLFNGGKAYLALDEGVEDILESGVDIIAQPPGKQLGNLGMMSGGEKALTAIALLFGIFQFRPSPFCVLDEIDAPLDDANCHRLVEMLREFAQTVQFIIITHNKITMQLADTIYGVTMDEPGVSRVLSIPRQFLKDPDAISEAAREAENSALAAQV